MLQITLHIYGIQFKEQVAIEIIQYHQSDPEGRKPINNTFYIANSNLNTYSAILSILPHCARSNRARLHGLLYTRPAKCPKLTEK